jgi:uncharacterized protein YkwD/methionine-rich copper-binding protein CopC
MVPSDPIQEQSVLRKVAAAVLAVPVLAILYLPLLARRSVAARLALLGSVAIVLVVAALGLSRPVATTATAPTRPVTALTDDAFRSIDAATDLRAGVEITFSEAMDPASVSAAVHVDPPTAVHTSWNAARTVLTITPADHWAAGAYHTITVDPGALAAGGRPMAQPARAAFVTRPATTARLAVTKTAGDATSVATAFRITFDRPVAATAVRAALRLSPASGPSRAAIGDLVADTGRPVGSGEALSFTFTPGKALDPGTAYALTLDSLVDADGATVADAEPLAIETSAAPRVVRVRPSDGTRHVDRSANLSVRFSEAMAHGSTRAALSVTASGKVVKGTLRFAEGNTVIVFDPASALPAGSTVVITVKGSATSIAGVPIGRDVSATVKTMPAPAARTATPTPARSGGGSGGSGGSGSGGGAVGGGSWGAVETYYLRLMNCTRTGGWVTSSGSCSSPGGRNVAPLRLDSGISSRVSRPYAKKLAVNNLCTHFSGGNPGNRLSAAGYTSYIWAENLGCRSGNPFSAVLGSHLYFQSEKSYNGGHYVNLMNSAYDRVGIGVWVSGGRVRVVIDFYHPR